MRLKANRISHHRLRSSGMWTDGRSFIVCTYIRMDGEKRGESGKQCLPARPNLSSPALQQNWRQWPHEWSHIRAAVAVNKDEVPSRNKLEIPHKNLSYCHRLIQSIERTTTCQMKLSLCKNVTHVLANVYTIKISLRSLLTQRCTRKMKGFGRDLQITVCGIELLATQKNLWNFVN